jgi:hypothetical protein
LQTNWLDFTLTNSNYGDVPQPNTIFKQYVNWLISRGYNYSGEWRADFAPGSTLDTEGFDLIQNFTYYASDSDAESSLYEKADAVLFVSHYHEYMQNKIAFKVAAKTERIRDQIVKQVKAGTRDYEKIVDDTKITVGFWRDAQNGGDIFSRDIDSKYWTDIKNNYSVESRDVLDQLTKVTPETLTGKIALLHGPAGTGKTTFLCSLARAWREWVDMEYVIDPEIFLNDANYIINVMLGGGQANDRYRMIVLEDAGELIAHDAKKQTGQGLSRLLNITDGMLGSGRKLLFAITTNDDIKSLHPAITRPGRCMFQAEIGKMSVTESNRWLGPDFNINEPATLAELYNIAREGSKNALGTFKKEGHIGQYL